MLYNSLYSFAVARAFDNYTPIATTKKEWNEQQRLFVNQTRESVEILTPYVEGSVFPRKFHQHILDALVSISYDSVPEVILFSNLPELLSTSKSRILYEREILTIECVNENLNPSLAKQCDLYHTPTERRRIEIELFFGHVLFMCGKTTNDKGKIVYNSYPLHPFLSWMMSR